MSESAPLVFATSSPLQRFTVDPDAFARWAAGLDDTVFPALPDRGQEDPGAMLSDLAYSAAEAGVLRGDPALEWGVAGNDSPNGSGFHVIISNNNGQPGELRITSGWIDLWWHDENTDDNAGRWTICRRSAPTPTRSWTSSRRCPEPRIRRRHPALAALTIDPTKGGTHARSSCERHIPTRGRRVGALHPRRHRRSVHVRCQQ